jgi:agmatinase
VTPPYDNSDVTTLMGVRLMMDVIGTMAKNGRIGGRLKI